MLWRLAALQRAGGTGAILSLMLTPFATALGNMMFALSAAGHSSDGREVVVNCVVNNLTVMLFLVGLVACLWKVEVAPEGRAAGGEKSQKQEGGDQKRPMKLWILTGFAAVLFFTAVFWALGCDMTAGRALRWSAPSLRFDAADALIMLATFVFWQVLYLLEVLKANKPEQKPISWRLVFNLLLVGVGLVFAIESMHWLLAWAWKGGLGLVGSGRLGWVSGLAMALPNAVVALYYGWRNKPEIVYGVQAADANICIPFCLALYVLYKGSALVAPAVGLTVPLVMFVAGVVLQTLFVGATGRLPRVIGILLIGCYAIGLGLIISGISR